MRAPGTQSSTVPPRRSPPPARAGFTLVEAILSLIIVATMLAAGLSAYAISAKTRFVLAGRAISSTLADQLLAEVLQARYKEPVDAPAFGQESGESSVSRADWDDVDDYHGWSEDANDPKERKDGSAITDTTGFTRQVSVAYADPSNPANNSATDQGLKRITVTVTDARGAVFTVIALRCSNGPADQIPTESTTFVTYVEVGFKGGSADKTISSGMNLVNSPIE